MDDLIYTLLVIGWIAFGIYTKVKKSNNKAASTNRAQSPKPTKTIDSVFESLFPTAATTIPDPHPYNPSNLYEEPVKEEDFAYEEMDYLDQVPDENVESKLDTYSGTDNVQFSTSTIKTMDMDEIKTSTIDAENEVEIESDAELFDLRQGIIARAILERPYL